MFTAAADVPAHRRAPAGARGVRAPPARRGHDHRGRGRRAGRGVADAAREGVRALEAAQRRPRRLARGHLVGSRAGEGIRRAPRQDRASTSRRCARSGRALTAIPADVRRAQEAAEAVRGEGAGDRERRGDRLGDRRVARVRHAADRGAADPVLRTGLGARHVLAAPRDRLRPERRASPCTARSHPRAPGEARGAEQPARGAVGARLRVRLFARRSAHARALGGAVRRLRERRAGDHRSVPRRGRVQVAAHVGDRDALAARLRGPGARALLRAPRALPADVRAGQSPGGEPHHARELLPRAAPPDAPQLPQAARRDDAEVAACATSAACRASPTSDPAAGSTA